MSLTNRRSFLSAGACSVALLRSTVLKAQSLEPLSELPPVPAKYASLAEEPPMDREFGDILQNQGTATPSDVEQKIAQEIVTKAPSGVAPLRVASFFLDVAKGEYGDNWRPYTRAWPKYAPANPLILQFFKATTTAPQGDLTAWCAAFLNWCLIQAQAKGGGPPGASAPTRHAGSRSFRSWGKDSLLYEPTSNRFAGTLNPRPGDLAVFQTMTNGNAQITGHVGFFLDMDADRVKVLGGNQFEGKPVVHAINVKWLPKRGGLQLHSIRSDPLLRW